MKIKAYFGKIPFPAWAFTALMVLYNELMLHFWITEELRAGRMAAVAAFALGLGAVLALVTAFLKEKGSKWAAVVLSFAVTVIMLVEFFVSDAYQVFMTPETIISGAGGVAQDYLDLVLSLLGRNLWRIGLMLLPVVAYGLFCAAPAAGRKVRCLLPSWLLRAICWDWARSMALPGTGTG